MLINKDKTKQCAHFWHRLPLTKATDIKHDKAETLNSMSLLMD